MLLRHFLTAQLSRIFLAGAILSGCLDVDGYHSLIAATGGAFSLSNTTLTGGTSSAGGASVSTSTSPSSSGSSSGGTSFRPNSATNLGGTSGTGGHTNKGGQSSTGGVTNRGGSPPVTCNPVTAPTNPLWTDFTEVPEGRYGPQDNAGFMWGDYNQTRNGLTGGTFYFSALGNVLTVATSQNAAYADVFDGKLEINGKMPDPGWSGFGFWLPGSCIDASAYRGISFLISGSLNTTQVAVYIGSSRNNPTRECVGSFGTDCTLCSKDITQAITLIPTRIDIPWKEFTDGKPVSPFDPHELTELQWQFTCDVGSCYPMIVVDNVTFY